MKRFIVSSMLLTLMLILVSGISPYIRVAEKTGPMKDVVAQVTTVIEEGGYEIIGQYQPGENPDLYVLVFTSEELISFTRELDDRGMLAAAMKVGFQKTGETIAVSFLNPEYLFYAYFQEKMNNASFNSDALKISAKVLSTMESVGSLQETFGGDLSAEKLMKYRYMAGMPNFEKPVSLAEFDTYDQGLAAIRNGLSKHEDKIQVYEIVCDSKETAIFGIGMKEKEKGEAHFLPIIGESHVAAMPYEIILQGNEVTMLHGRFRLALHWPELTMGTFMKIKSAPGDVEDAMKGLFETD